MENTIVKNDCVKKVEEKNHSFNNYISKFKAQKADICVLEEKNAEDDNEEGEVQGDNCFYKMRQ